MARSGLPIFNFVPMLTKEEESFITYWEQNRDKNKKILNGLAYGLPLGLVFTFAIVLNVASGWYKRATMILNTDSSLILVLIIAILLIIVFIAVYSVKHRWDLNEQRYRELTARKE